MELEKLKQEIQNNDAVMIYFSGDFCGVCKVLQPKIKHLFDENFSKIKQIYISADKFPKTAAQFDVLTIPTVIVYFDTKEFIRESRHISIDNLSNKIARPYGLFFNQDEIK